MHPGFAPLFTTLESVARLTGPQRAKLEAILVQRRLAKGEFFSRAGLPNPFLAFMAGGLLRYYYLSAEGREYIRHFCMGGHFVSTTAAYQDAAPSDYFIEALEDSDLITFRSTDWARLMASDAVWGVLNAHFQAEAIRLAERRERSLILDDAAERYRGLLREFPGIEDRVRQYDIANYLGITPVALSRIRSKTSRE